jgi:hypothetical protein
MRRVCRVGQRRKWCRHRVGSSLLDGLSGCQSGRPGFRCGLNSTVSGGRPLGNSADGPCCLRRHVAQATGPAVWRRRGHDDSPGWMRPNARPGRAPGAHRTLTDPVAAETEPAIGATQLQRGPGHTERRDRLRHRLWNGPFTIGRETSRIPPSASHNSRPHSAVTSTTCSDQVRERSGDNTWE